MSKHLAIPKRTAYSSIEKGVSLRDNWSSVTKRRRKYSLVNESLKIMFEEKIIKHLCVVVSPISIDTILVRNSITGKKRIRFAKYSTQISIRELHLKM